MAEMPRHALSPATAAGTNFLLESDSNSEGRLFRNGLVFHDVFGYGPGRGINLAVLHPVTGEIEEIEVFDTWFSSALASQYAAQFVSQIVPGHIVMLTVADANYLNQHPEDAQIFETDLGSRFASIAEFRDTWAMISRMGDATSLVEIYNPYTASGGYVKSSVSLSLLPVTSADTTPPQGSFRINNGATVTSTNLVTLDLSQITDSQSGLVPAGKMRFSNDGNNWSPMVNFATTANWALPRGSGPKTMYAEFRDAAGNWTPPIAASISLSEAFPLKVPGGTPSTYCASTGRLLGLNADGTLITSGDWGNTWLAPQAVLPAADFAPGFLSCNDVGEIAVASFSGASAGQFQIAVNTSRDTGQTWQMQPTLMTVTGPASQQTSGLGVCETTAGLVSVFWMAEDSSGNDQVFSLASRDFGATWDAQPDQITNLPDTGRYLLPGDVQFACQPRTALVAVLHGSNVLALFRSTNGAASFDALADPSAANVDSFTLAADAVDNVYVFTSNPGGAAGTSHVTIQHSGDGGNTWALPSLVPGADTADFRVAAGGVGLIYLAWPEYVSAADGWDVRLTVSINAGQNWLATPATVSSLPYWDTFAFVEKPDVNNLLLAANSGGGVALLWVDDRQGLGDGHCVIRYGVEEPGRSGNEDAPISTPSDLYLAWSNDFGSTWHNVGPLNESYKGSQSVYASPTALLVGSTGAIASFWDSTAGFGDVRFMYASQSPETSFALTPNPISAVENSFIGVATVNWRAPSATSVEIHLLSPGGPLFAAGGSSGSAPTGTWVTDGMLFYLQDTTSGEVYDYAHTLAVATANLQPAGNLTADPNPLPDGSEITTLSWNAPGSSAVEVHVNSPTGVLFTEGGSTGSSVTGPWASAGLSFYLIDESTRQTLGSMVIASPAVLRADPNPITPSYGSQVGATNVTWVAPSATFVEVHVGGPNGPLFASGGANGSAMTGTWVTDGTVFYLQDASRANSTLLTGTLATLVVHVQQPL